MKKKSLRPQQTAPVQRETTATSSSIPTAAAIAPQQYSSMLAPFAGDAAE